MDLKSFGDNEFDPKQWINQAWCNNNSHVDEEIFVGNIVGKLELYMKQLNNNIEETTSQVVASIPRVLQDAGTLQNQVSALSSRLCQLKTQINDVEVSTHSVKVLQHIDKIKNKLENARSALKEADKWAQMLTTIEDILDGSSVPTSGEKFLELVTLISDMTSSLEVLSESPDYKEKCSQMDSICNKLDAAYSPMVVETLTNKLQDDVRNYYLLYSAMDRKQELLKYWRRIEITNLQRSIQAIHCSLGESHVWMRHLLTTVMDHCINQIDWLRNLLKVWSPMKELVDLYCVLLNSIEPRPSKVIGASLSHLADAGDCVAHLCAVQTVLLGFVEDFNKILEKHKDERVPEESLLCLYRAVFAPMQELMSRYTELQARILITQLHTVCKDEGEIIDQCRSTSWAVERCSAWLEQASTTARKLVGNAGYIYLIPAVEAFVSANCSRLSSNLRHLQVEDGYLPSALLLTGSAAELTVILQKFIEKEHQRLLTEEPKSIAGVAMEVVLLDSEGYKRMEQLKGAADMMLSDCVEDLKRVCRTLKGYVLKIIFEIVAVQLDKLPSLKIWSENDPLSADVPDFSLTPQEYITQIGQYLMTLPQHIEPYLRETQTSLVHVIEEDGVYNADLSWYLVNEVCKLTCDMYVDRILSIKHMDTLGVRRCTTDIAYLSSVVEDLGACVTPSLKNLENTLRQARNTN